MTEEKSQGDRRICVRCESCGKKYRLSTKTVGKKAKCSCGHIFIISISVEERESVLEAHKPAARLADENNKKVISSHDRINIEANQDDLQTAANHMVLVQGLRKRGIGSIVFGIIAILMGVLLINENELNVLVVLFGFILFFEGIWLRVRPRPKGLIIDGILLLILGIWNTAISIPAIKAEGWQPNPGESYTGLGQTFLAIGIAQIIWGLWSFVDYVVNRNVKKPAREFVDWIYEVYKGIGNVNMIFFLEPSWVSKSRSRMWLGCLRTDGAVFIKGKPAGNAIVGNSEEDIQIMQKVQVNLKVGKGDKKTSLQLGSLTIKGFISTEDMQKYKAWKSGTTPLPAR
jgi:hypothetical protein